MFPTTSPHPMSVAAADRAASGYPPTDRQRRVTLRIRPSDRSAGILRRRVVAVAAGHHHPSRSLPHHDRWLGRQGLGVQPADAGTAFSHGAATLSTVPSGRRHHTDKTELNEADAAEARQPPIHLTGRFRDPSSEPMGRPWRSHRPTRVPADITPDRLSLASRAQFDARLGAR
jgi:hypothetical protein